MVNLVLGVKVERLVLLVIHLLMLSPYLPLCSLAISRKWQPLPDVMPTQVKRFAYPETNVPGAKVLLREQTALKMLMPSLYHHLSSNALTQHTTYAPCKFGPALIYLSIRILYMCGIH